MEQGVMRKKMISENFSRKSRISLPAFHLLCNIFWEKFELPLNWFSAEISTTIAHAKKVLRLDLLPLLHYSSQFLIRN